MTPFEPTTFRFTAHAMTRELDRAMFARLWKGRYLALAAALLAISVSLVPWGWAGALSVATFLVLWYALLLLSGLLSNRRVAARYFPEGSLTTVGVGPDELVITGPNSTRSVPYSQIRAVRVINPWVLLLLGRMKFERIPVSMLPESTLEFIRGRVQGRWPPEMDPQPERRAETIFVIPAGWAAKVARVKLRSDLTSGRFWSRFVLIGLVAGVLGATTDPGLLLLLPLYVALTCFMSYIRTKQQFDLIVPEGSVATVELVDDGFVSRNRAGFREIRYEDVVSVRVRGDVTCLRLRTFTGVLLIATALIPQRLLD